MNERTVSLSKEHAPQHHIVLGVHFKLHGGDGISLQAQLLEHALLDSSYDIHECSADVPPNTKGLAIPELAYQSPEVHALRQDIFHPDGAVPAEQIAQRLDVLTTKIQTAMERYIKTNTIRVVHIHNLFSVPYNPAATIAAYRLAREHPDIQFIAQHHDFVFEKRQDIFPTPPNPAIAKQLDEAVLPTLPNITHCVLNRDAAEYLWQTKHIRATVLPDGFDFDIHTEPHASDTFRKNLGIREQDIVVGVMTRIVSRKAIEFAIRFVHDLTAQRAALENYPGGIGPNHRAFTKESAIYLVLPQGEDLTDNGHYFDILKQYAADMNVHIIEAGSVVDSDIQHMTPDEGKTRFYDIYPGLDIVCYPTTQEGFGNQLLEAVALAPNTIPLLFEYPVFKREIAPCIPYIISLGDTYTPLTEYPELKSLPPQVMETAVNEAISMLTHPEDTARKAQENRRLLRAKFDIRLIANAFSTLIPKTAASGLTDAAETA